MNRLNTFARWATNLFLVWVLIAAVVAFVWPEGFKPLKPYITPGLGLIMFGMGMTLTLVDFQRVAEKPRAVLVGVLAQYLIMPFAAVVVVRLLRLPDALAAGVILVGCCPGGTASNVMAYLAKGDVALSVTMTSISTLASVVATPYLMQFLAGQYVPVDAVAMLKTIFTIILLPVTLGLIVRRFLGRHIAEVSEILPLVSVVVIVAIVACVVALVKPRIIESGGLTMLAVTLHNALGLAVGYGVARLCRLDQIRARTIAIEVGMQNSGMGAVLAVKHFAAKPLVALPSALFSVWHNVTGPALASWWGRKGGNDELRNQNDDSMIK